MGVDPHVLQRRYRAQPLENPHAAQGGICDPVGFQDQFGERRFQILGRAGQQLRGNPVVDQAVLFFQQTLTQHAQ